MKWELEYSDKEFSLQARISKNLPLPEWAMEEPPLYPGDDFFLTAFYQLSSCRQITDSGIGQIPWNVIILYANHRELDEVVSRAFEHIISEMDTEYIKWQRKKQDALKPKGKSNASLRHTS